MAILDKKGVDLSIITVTYQSKDFIDGCILSVVTSTLGISYEHFIVDNASADGTAAFIEENYASYVKLIKNTRNLGFAAANNQAVAKAKGRYILFLNPDMQIEEGSLDSLVAWMDAHPDAGISCCKLVNAADKTPTPALRPMKFIQPLPLLALYLNRCSFYTVLKTHFSYENFDDNALQEVDHSRGAFFLVRREIIDKLGWGFDPRYFIMIEDVDLCKEVKRLGYKIYYNPSVSCVDYRGASFAQKPKAWNYIQFCRSSLSYFCKWHSRWHCLWIPLAATIGFLLRMPGWGLKQSLKALTDQN